MSKKCFLTLSNIVFFVYMALINSIITIFGYAFDISISKQGFIVNYGYEYGFGYNVALGAILLITFALLIVGIIYYVLKANPIILMISMIQMVITNFIYGVFVLHLYQTSESAYFIALIPLITWFLGRFLLKEKETNPNKLTSDYKNVFAYIVTIMCGIMLAITLFIENIAIAFTVLLVIINLLLLFINFRSLIPCHIIIGALTLYSIAELITNFINVDWNMLVLRATIAVLGIFYFCMLFIPQGKKMVSKINKFYQQGAKRNKELNYSEKESSFVNPNTQDNGNAISSKIAKLELLNSLKDRQAISIDFYEKEKQNIMEGK